MTIPDFIARCDAYCQTAGVTRNWLSKRLLKDTFRLEQLAAGKVDIGVRRLERAVSDLEGLFAYQDRPASAGAAPISGAAA